MGERRLSAARVLVVDDEPEEREPLARLIGKWGYDVETAATGDEALALEDPHHLAEVADGDGDVLDAFDLHAASSLTGALWRAPG